MERIRTLVTVTALAGWLATIVATLMRHELPDPTLLGIPAGLWLAIRPWPTPWSKQQGPTPPPTEGTDP